MTVKKLKRNSRKKEREIEGPFHVERLPVDAVALIFYKYSLSASLARQKIQRR